MPRKRRSVTLCTIIAALLVLPCLTALAKGPGGGGHSGGGHGGHIVGPSAGGATVHSGVGRTDNQSLSAPGSAGGTQWRSGQTGWGSYGGSRYAGSYFGGWWPWYSFDYWRPWYGGYYGYWGPSWGWGYGQYGLEPYGAGYVVGAPVSTTPPEPTSALGSSYVQARDAFARRDYGSALRLAGHTAIDHPHNRDVHLLLSAALFATGDFRGAAMEAHATAAIGPLPDWQTLFGLYGDAQVYTEQLRALEKSAEEHPSMAEGRFLLGFHYLVDGHREAAQPEFLEALKLTPQDGLAAQLLTQSGGTVPDNLARRLSSPPTPGQATTPQGPQHEEAQRPIPAPPVRR